MIDTLSPISSFDGLSIWVPSQIVTFFPFLNGKKIFLRIQSNFEKIKAPSEKILFDMANLSKQFKNYAEAISYYNKLLSRLDKNSVTYADVLYRRGGGFERLGNYIKSDKFERINLDL